MVPPHQFLEEDADDKSPMCSALGVRQGFGGCCNVSCVAKTNTPSTKTVSHGLTFWIFGRVGTQHVDINADCGAAGVAKIQSRQTVVDEILTLVTLPIYAPRTTVVTCAEGGSAVAETTGNVVAQSGNGGQQ